MNHVAQQERSEGERRAPALRPWVRAFLAVDTAARGFGTLSELARDAAVQVLVPEHTRSAVSLACYDRAGGYGPDDRRFQAGLFPWEARAFAQAIVAEMHGGFGALRNDCTMNVGVRVAPKPMSPALRRNVARVREIFEEALARFGGPWLAGADFTAADAFYAPVAFRIRTYGLDVGRGAEWVERVIAHPAMQEWEAQALAETWREASHEDELAAAGTVTADYRQA